MRSETSSLNGNRWWQKPAAILAAVAPILALALASWDYTISAWFARLDLPGDIEKSLQLSEAFAHGSGVIAIFASLLAVDKGRRRKILNMIAMVVIIMSVANACKLLISRSRPYTFDELTSITGTWFNKSEKEGYDTTIRSFPSGHSATAAAMAFALTNLYPRGKYIFIFLAAMACLQRITSRSHFPTDVLAGVTVAATIALVWQYAFPQYFKEPEEVQEKIGVSQEASISR
jgi:membrane-associated phospholipid phosphatase